MVYSFMGLLTEIMMNCLLKVATQKTMRGLRKRVNDRISWIYDEILRDYGVLVIDGWDPESDWLSFCWKMREVCLIIPFFYLALRTG